MRWSSEIHALASRVLPKSSRRTAIASLMAWLLLTIPAWSRVLLRWDASELPSAERLGVDELVIPFASDRVAAVQSASKQGYRVYLELPLAQFSEAQKTLAATHVAGFFVEAGDTHDPAATLQTLQSQNSQLNIRRIEPNGKQPRMRGQTVTTKDGVLQVSSPTAQPWLDSNVAMIRFAQAMHPGVTPAYSFAWDLNTSLEQENGPNPDDYALAIAEAGALHADLVLPLHPALEQKLLANDTAALATWKKLLSFVRFASTSTATTKPWSNVAVIAADYDAAYEPMNLMARHNIPFRFLTAVSAHALDDVKVAVALTPPTQSDGQLLQAFARAGGTIVVVNAKGKYPWQSTQPVQSGDEAMLYTTGKGRVYELAEPVSDPEAFAEDVRRLTPKDDVLISLWNALTTIAIPYRNARTGEIVIELLNFAEEPMRIQVQLHGAYSSIRYETPDRGCCQDLSGTKRNGFTDFIVPSLTISGRVYLKAGALSSGSQKK